MNDEEMDAALREYGGRWRDAQDAPDVTVRTPAARRWPVAGAAAAAVLAIVGGAVGVQSLREPDASRPASIPGPTPRIVAVVPWRPQPVAQPDDTDPGATAGEDVPACRRDELTMEARFAVPPALRDATVAGLLELTNASGRRCRVQSKVLWRPDGVRADRGDTTAELGRPAVLDPGEIAVSHLHWWGQRCQGASDLRRIRVDFSGNDGLGSATVPAFGLVRGACDRSGDGGDRGGGGWTVPLVGHAERQLALTVQAPREVAQGGVLQLRATLTNPTTRPVTLDECPVVRMELGDIAQHHTLDCGSVRLFAPGDSVQFLLEAPAGRSVMAPEDSGRERVSVSVGAQHASAPIRILPPPAPTPASSAVPWKPDRVTTAPTPTAHESAPSCAEDALEMTAYFAPPTADQRGPVAGVLEIRNVGELICRVQSKFSFLPKGAKMPDGAGVTDELGPPAILAPGDLAVSSLTWWGAECGGQADLARIDLIPHSNDRLEQRDIQAIGLKRGACPRPFGDIGSGSWAVTVTRRPDLGALRLTVGLDAPASVRRGETVRFTVTLTNPSNEPVALNRAKCPIVAFGVDTLEKHRLQCKDNYAFAPGQSVRFRFETKAPAQPPADGSKGPGDGTALLQWHFDAMPFGGQSIPVTVE
ncbi:MAG TPA: hypothetical protein VEZ46_13425 [Mycobacteriales bacterium]|nr:hypothetical protein [Mycobacteriales bacterium]